MNRDVCEHFNPADLPCDKCKSANVQKSTLREAAQQALTLLELISQATTKQFGISLEIVDNLKAALAEPMQEPAWVCPDSAEHRYQKPGHCEDCGKTLVQERHFCPRCGKRTNDIHTCTPP